MAHDTPAASEYYRQRRRRRWGTALHWPLILSLTAFAVLGALWLGFACRARTETLRAVGGLQATVRWQGLLEPSIITLGCVWGAAVVAAACYLAVQHRDAAASGGGKGSGTGCCDHGKDRWARLTLAHGAAAALAWLAFLVALVLLAGAAIHQDHLCVLRDALGNVLGSPPAGSWGVAPSRRASGCVDDWELVPFVRLSTGTKGCDAAALGQVHGQLCDAVRDMKVVMSVTMLLVVASVLLLVSLVLGRPAGGKATLPLHINHMSSDPLTREHELLQQFMADLQRSQRRDMDRVRRWWLPNSAAGNTTACAAHSLGQHCHHHGAAPQTPHGSLAGAPKAGGGACLTHAQHLHLQQHLALHVRPGSDHMAVGEGGGGGGGAGGGQVCSPFAAASAAAHWQAGFCSVEGHPAAERDTLKEDDTGPSTSRDTEDGDGEGGEKQDKDSAIVPDFSRGSLVWPACGGGGCGGEGDGTLAGALGRDVGGMSDASGPFGGSACRLETVYSGQESVFEL